MTCDDFLAPTARERRQPSFSARSDAVSALLSMIGTELIGAALLGVLVGVLMGCAARLRAGWPGCSGRRRAG